MGVEEADSFGEHNQPKVPLTLHLFQSLSLSLAIALTLSLALSHTDQGSSYWLSYHSFPAFDQLPPWVDQDCTDVLLPSIGVRGTVKATRCSLLR